MVQVWINNGNEKRMKKEIWKWTKKINRNDAIIMYWWMQNAKCTMRNYKSLGKGYKKGKKSIRVLMKPNHVMEKNNNNNAYIWRRRICSVKFCTFCSVNNTKILGEYFSNSIKDGKKISNISTIYHHHYTINFCSVQKCTSCRAQLQNFSSLSYIYVLHILYI